jgi:hypothetical protein
MALCGCLGSRDNAHREGKALGDRGGAPSSCGTRSCFRKTAYLDRRRWSDRIQAPRDEQRRSLARTRKTDHLIESFLGPPHACACYPRQRVRGEASGGFLRLHRSTVPSSGIIMGRIANSGCRSHHALSHLPVIASKRTTLRCIVGSTSTGTPELLPRCSCTWLHRYCHCRRQRSASTRSRTRHSAVSARQVKDVGMIDSRGDRHRRRVFGAAPGLSENEDCEGHHVR